MYSLRFPFHARAHAAVPAHALW